MADPPNNICPPDGTYITPHPHPSQGGNAYSSNTQQTVLNMWLNGEDLKSPTLDLLRQQKKFPSSETCKVWIRQFTTHGHIDPKRATGNHRAERELRGEWLVRLAIYRTVNPKATISKTRAYLYNLQPQNNCLLPL